MPSRECCDCAALPDDERPARPRPIASGIRKPRCDTHTRAKAKASKAAQRQRYEASQYGLPPGFYESLYRQQGGRCAWCNLADGGSKKLAIDHDHTCCAGKESCGKCVRGLLCGVCNQFLGYRMRDNPEAIRRGARYLDNPPAQQLYLNWPPTG